jgi:hypothetical protein
MFKNFVQTEVPVVSAFSIMLYKTVIQNFTKGDERSFIGFVNALIIVEDFGSVFTEGWELFQIGQFDIFVLGHCAFNSG